MKKQEEIKVVVVEAGKKPYEKTIKNNLETFQELVEGYIEFVYPHNDNTFICCNEEAKLIGLEPNRRICNGRDVICGTFFITCEDEEADGECGSLTDEQIAEYIEKYSVIEEISEEECEPYFEITDWYLTMDELMRG